MLFDSPEKCITEKNAHHKHNKYKDILRWDYLVTDTAKINYLFNSSFLFDSKKILPYGYPRVHYLLKWYKNAMYKKRLRRFYSIPEEKKVVLYLPTWRDYNYGIDTEQFDLGYLLNLSNLQQLLGSEYEIIYKDHTYLSKPENVDFKNFSSAETQELLLIADYLITDYSSVMFDAFAIDLPVILYCNDFEKNESARGVYPCIWNSLSSFVCTDLQDIAKKIKHHSSNPSYYNEIRNNFCCDTEEGNDTLKKFILNL